MNTITDIKGYFITRGFKEFQIETCITAFELIETPNSFIIPMKNLDGDTISSKTRIYEPRDGKTKSINESGKPQGYMFTGTLKFTDPIIIVEGEIDVLSAYALNIQNVIGLSSCGQLSNLIEELIVKGVSKVYICGDNDSATDLHIKKLMMKIGPMFINNSICVYDARSYLKIHNQKDLNDLMNNNTKLKIDFGLLTADASQIQYVNTIISDVKEIYRFDKDRGESYVCPKRLSNFINNTFDIVKDSEKKEIYYLFNNEACIRDEVKSVDIIEKVILQILKNIPDYLHASKVRKECLAILEDLTLNSESLSLLYKQKHEVSKNVYFKDAILDLNTMTTKKITKKNFVNSYYDYHYSTVANAGEPVEFIKLLHDMLKNHPKKEKAIEAIQIFLGSILIDTHNFRKALVIHGKGGDGKGTICDLLELILGEKNCKSISLKTLNEKFGPDQIYGKKLIYDPDADYEIKRGSSTIKSIITGDSITVDVKHSTPITFRYNGRVLIITNKIGLFDNLEENTLRRYIIVDNITKVTRKDGHAKYLYSKEKNEIMNWILSGTKKIMSGIEFDPYFSNVLKNNLSKDYGFYDFISSEIYIDLHDDSEIINGNRFCTKKEVKDARDKFMISSGYPNCGNTMFNKLLKVLNFKEHRTSKARGYFIPKPTMNNTSCNISEL